jgi:hypothetical protein
MKPCDAAAFALVVWYLLSPPFPRSATTVDINAPLHTWQLIDGFDTAQQCTNNRSRERELLDDPKTVAELEAKDKDWNLATARARMVASQCIASDDPHLKGN